jgi:CBS domain-containing protein
VLLAPPRMSGRYLQALGAFSRVLSRPAVVDRILEAHSGEEVLKLQVLQEVELAPQLRVREIMTESPRSTRPDALLRDAARDLVRSGIGALPVIEADGLLVGMLSERELMRHMLSLASINGSIPRPQSGIERQRRTVRDVMTRQVLCVSPDQPLAEVASLMTNKDVDRVPVVQEGRLVGFLTRSDIVRKLIGS